MPTAADTPSDSARLPERLGRYELIGKVASGGMATVYLGRAVGTAGFERLVAIKACHPHLAEDLTFQTMFLDEARLSARIHHPNVVATIDVSDAGGLFQVMEYVEGGRVTDLIAATRAAGERVAIPVALRILADALSGLEAAHMATDVEGRPLRIVHRDISPQNILVGVDGVTRVADFGVAKAEARATVTTGGQIKGKLSYMAPEQLARGASSRQSDICSAGVVLWEILTGQRLVQGDSKTDLVQQVLFRPFVPPSAAAPEVAPELDSIVKRAMHRSPEARYESARDFAEALEEHGGLASQRQVADYVTRWLEDAIEQRRALARGQRSHPEMAGENLSSHVRQTSSFEQSGRRGRMGWIVVGAVVVLLAAVALGWAVGFFGRSDPQLSELPSASTLPEPRPPAEVGVTQPESPVPGVEASGPTTDEAAQMRRREVPDGPLPGESTAQPGATIEGQIGSRRRTRRGRRARRPPRHRVPVKATNREFEPDFL